MLTRHVLRFAADCWEFRDDGWLESFDELRGPGVCCWFLLRVGENLGPLGRQFAKAARSWFSLLMGSSGRTDISVGNDVQWFEPPKDVPDA